MFSEAIELSDGDEAGKERRSFKSNPKKARADGQDTILPCELSETHYEFDNGLRRVFPYFYTFQVYAKGRWIGKSITEIFVREFRGHSIDYYIKMIVEGEIQVNNSVVSPDRIVVAHDLITHRIHRHEPPVLNIPIGILHVDDKIIVINKPSSIPIHPSGRYRHNSVIFILAHEFGYCNLYPVHRLDRLTSGIVIFARSSSLARELALRIREKNKIQKFYLARVEGEFPPTKVTVDQPILIAIDIGSRELNKVSQEGKPCQTEFERLFFDGKESIVLCKPLTGRTHQIRVHLKWLGYPIVNDPLYNDKFKEKFGEKWQIDMSELEKDELLVNVDEILPKGPELKKCIDKKIHGYKSRYPDSATNIDKEGSNSTRFCSECLIKYRDPKPYEAEIYLHAWRYLGDEIDFVSPRPSWSEIGFVTSFGA